MFKGAFGDDDPGLWIENWSWLDANGYLATYKSPVTVKNELSDDAKMYIIIGVVGAVLLIMICSFYFYRRGRTAAMFARLQKEVALEKKRAERIDSIDEKLGQKV